MKKKKEGINYEIASANGAEAIDKVYKDEACFGVCGQKQRLSFHWDFLLHQLKRRSVRAHFSFVPWCWRLKLIRIDREAPNHAIIFIIRC